MKAGIGPCRECGKSKSKLTKPPKIDPSMKPVLECLNCGYKLVRKTEEMLLEVWNRPSMRDVIEKKAKEKAKEK